mmetsp:Transcript_30701/g.77025  ORF Transcript_30701/g.77025 Transcript_30701/m.77025 type:complete len:1146 (-) Transcript_30701:11-3448(-)
MVKLKKPAVANIPRDKLRERRRRLRLRKGYDQRRVVYSNDPTENSRVNYVTNYLRTTKYTLWNFLFKNLYEQLKRVANIFFIVIAIISLTPVSPIAPGPGVATVIIVLAVSAIKEAVEDYKRYRSDREVNNRTVKAVRAGSNRAERILWSDVKVGDILKVKEGEEIPADLFLISSADLSGRSHIQTANLDGETNLKMRTALPETRENRTFEQLSALRIEVDCEEPNPELYEYEGTLSVGDEELPVGSDQLLLRGSRLANTKWVYGLVIYTGRQTKFVLNMADPPYKNSNVEKVTNRLIIGVLFLLLAMCLLSAILGAVWDDTSGKDHTYIDLPSGDSVVVVIIQRFFTFLILYNNMIPISLYVSIEMVRIMQAYFLNEDRLMYDPATESRMIPRTSNLNEELGQVSFIFSDKTGTLTANEMVFRCGHIGGTVYGEVPDLAEEYRRLDEAIDAEVDVKAEDVSTSKSQGLMYNQPGHTEFGSEMLETALEAGGDAAGNLRDFFVNMAVNHTVMPVIKNDRLIYQASSPDEEALLEGAAAAGVVLRSRDNDILTVDVFDEAGLQFQVLQVNHFTSERKRMSVVARFPDGSLRLLAKGADQTMLPLLGEDPATLDAAVTDMENFASNGLRTLVVAERVLTEEEHAAWVEQYYRPASISTTNRGQLLVEAAAQIESGLRLVGVTGVEDKLQRGVPDTIATLLRAGIRIWVLTGDKKETAENIADACNLLAGAERLVLDHATKAETEAQLAAWEDAWDAEEDYALIVNGRTLTFCLEPDVELDFLEVARRCVSVVIARAAPIQKRQVVELVQREMGEISLAVGDGANDVPMIQAAEIGVGIRGKEGMQAALSSDYSIGQFRFLKRLLLVHGHWNYKRIAFLVCYFFYKNFVISFIPFWFAIDNHFSGQPFFDAWLRRGYNVLFTALPIFSVAVLEQDVNDLGLLKFPQLYRDGQRNVSFSKSRIIKWLTFGVLDSAILYYFTRLTVYANGYAFDTTGQTPGLFIWGTLAFTCMVWLGNFRLAIHTRLWTAFHHVFFWLTILSWPLALAIYSSQISFFLGSGHMYYVGYRLFASPSFWLAVPVIIVAALLPDFLWRALRRNFRPRGFHIVSELYDFKEDPDLHHGYKKRICLESEDYCCNCCRYTCCCLKC